MRWLLGLTVLATALVAAAVRAAELLELTAITPAFVEALVEAVEGAAVLLELTALVGATVVETAFVGATVV